MGSHARCEQPRNEQDDRQQGSLTPNHSVKRVVSSESLFKGVTEIGIEHGGAMYRLKITRQGKLILNK